MEAGQLDYHSASDFRRTGERRANGGTIGLHNAGYLRFNAAAVLFHMLVESPLHGRDAAARTRADNSGG